MYKNASARNIIQYFEDGLARKSLVHAYVFLGPRYTDKEIIVTHVAKILLSSENHNHPDQITLAPGETGSITIADVRNLRKRLYTSSINGGTQIAVIHDAEHMQHEAQNALLKILEEPAPGTYIFLLAHHPKQLLPTIISRTVPFYFSAPIRREDLVSEHYSTVCEIANAPTPSDRIRSFMKYQFPKDAHQEIVNDLTYVLRNKMRSARTPRLADALYELLAATERQVGQNWQLVIERALISY